MPSETIETTTVTFPEGVEPKQLPPAAEVENRAGRYEATYTREGRAVTVKRSLVLHRASAVCTPEDYQEIRALGQAVGRDLRAQIVY